MDQLAKEQEVHGQEIQRIINNYKKDPATRKISAAYYTERLQRLEAAWSIFVDVDKEIKDLADAPEDHPYFTSNYYDELKEVYNKYRDHFSLMASSLKEPIPNQDNLTQPGKFQDLQLQDANARKQTSIESKAPQALLAPSGRSYDVNEQFQESSSTGAIPKGRKTHDCDVLDTVRIIRRQKAVIQSLLRILTNIETLDESQYSKSLCELKINSIKQYWTQIETQHHTIWELIDDPTTLGYDIGEYIHLEERVQESMVILSTKLEAYTSSTASRQPLPNVSTILKLPKITLPKFDGDYTKWRQFHDLFSQMVHNQPMSNCQKMWYLKTNLLGEAEKLLRHFTLSDENYTSAWKMLQERYDNPRLQVAALINKLLAQPSHANESATANTIRSMHDITQECLMGLENIGVPTANWDPLLLHILLKRLDRNSHSLYEQSLSNPKELQSLTGFLAFLETRFQALESLGSKTRIAEKDHHKRSFAAKTLTTFSAKCICCNNQHPLYHCQRFLEMSPSARLNLLRKHNMCINCLKIGHITSKCTLRGCTKCGKKHNTLVHLELTIGSERSHKTSGKMFSTNSNSNEPPAALMTSTTQQERSYVLLSTARVKLLTNNGREIECRALLDSGSQINLITERIIKKLDVTPTIQSISIHGIGHGKQQSQQRVNVELQSRINGFSLRLEAFVLPRIISPQPTQSLDVSTWAIPHNIQLADPVFERPDRIDLLLGAEFYYHLLSIGQIRLGKDLPILQNTVLGWVVAGKSIQTPMTLANCGVCTGEETLDRAIERFWRVEESEPVRRSHFTPDEKQCETHFNQTVRRDSSGRFVVRLPFSKDPTTLGQSRDIAMRRFMALERKLSMDSSLCEQYNKFMTDYLDLGHMEEVDIDSIRTPHYFLPHHSVLKPESSTTKLRVVFDASAKTSTNLSLNDIIHAGPVLQDDLFSILLRFRLPKFVFTADIEKMYRQVIIHNEDRKYQLILWRNDKTQALKCYQLRTVTYGTSSAPYLATKCLQRLAQTEAAMYPDGAHALQHDFYMDDVMTGADSLVTAQHMQAQLLIILRKAGFNLRKWCANHPRLLRDIPPENQELALNFTDEKDSAIKTLGLIWMPKSDQFCVKTQVNSPCKVTKRTVASDIAKLFDPLGVMAPVVVTAKIFLQQLWELKLDWDASLPMELHTRWSSFRDSMQLLNNIQFPRHIFDGGIPKSVQFHAFADASEKAYGAAVYVRSINNEGRVMVRLLCAKSRVAPAKKLTLPRLELCAAKLAAELTQRVRHTLRMENNVTYLWTDSTIVLAWINSKSSSFHTFVANRIAAIQEVTIGQQWRHVTSKENPADILSRGMAPDKLQSCNLWFYGPPYLHGTESIWPPSYTNESQCELERKTSTLPIITDDEVNQIHFIYKINHGNSFRKLQRVVGYVVRFVKTIKKSTGQGLKTMALNTSELDEALCVIIRQLQEGEFHEDINYLTKFKEIKKTSQLTSLTPFLDERRILRVGGRLEAATLPYDAKHPMLLPYSSEFTKLLMAEIHRENNHVGPQGLLSITRQRFWPIKGKTIARSVVQHCIRCAKSKPRLLSQIMGNLPPTRVQPARPFVNAGVDFCGPVWVHYKSRGKRPQKAYIAVYCCFATKAVHLEVVSDLSTDAFIGSLKRFIGRRGHCQNLYCDNATNFVGAKNQLQELTQVIHSNEAQGKIISACSGKGIDFHFIPPRAPHFGGLWEAAVKSAKYLLQRTVASASLTYEELETVMVEIEAVLNSRPLTPMSANPNDLTALTPGHFIIGEPLTSTIDSQATPLRASLLTRWKLVSQLKHEFWKRWSQEYLHELQHRYKWKEQAPNIKPGTIVWIKEENVPVRKWPLGRIINVHKGEDGRVRVVDLRTERGIFRRPIHNLAPLPCEDKESNELPTDEINTAQGHSARDQTKRHNEDQDLSERSSEASELPSKKTRKSFSSSILTFLLACLIVPAVRANPVEIIHFNDQLGIHFENLGSLNLVTTEWKLVVYYDLQPYWMEVAVLENSTIALQHLCDQINQKSSCRQIIQQFRHLQEELRKDDVLLSTQQTSTRNRRGVFNIVGNVANSLFGVLDSQYAEEMSHTINSIKGNEQHLLGLLKNQTSVIDSTINIIKRDQASAEKKFQALDNHITQIINRINISGEQDQQARVQQIFTSTALQMTLIIGNLQRIQSAILDVLTDSHHGRINPLLLSPFQLKRELTTIRNHLPTSVHLPCIQGNILQLYSLMTARAGIANNHLIFQLMLPLTSGENFDLFRVIPIPTLINNTFMAVLPDFPYLAITPHKDQYYPIKEQALSSCTIIEETTHLCKQLHPIYHKGADISSCELEFMNNAPTPSGCKLTHMTQQPIWIQLSHNNQWIFALQKRTAINVVCDGEALPIVLNGSGLLKFQPSCVIKENFITIRGHESYSNELRTSYTKLGISSALQELQEQQSIISEQEQKYQSQLVELKNLQEQLTSLDVSELPNKVYAHTIHHFAVSYTALLIIILIVLYLGWNFRARICKPQTAKPKPKPRRCENLNYSVEV